MIQVLKRSAPASLVPEDVQVHGASSTEIRHAVESIIEESVEDDGLDLSEHDLDLLVENETSHWKGRPIEVSQSLERKDVCLTGATVCRQSCVPCFDRRRCTRDIWPTYEKATDTLAMVCNLVPPHVRCLISPSSRVWDIRTGKVSG